MTGGISAEELEAARRGVQRQGFTEVVEAAFRNTISELAMAAEHEGLTFPDACSAITTGAQAAVMRLLARFTEYDSAEELEEAAREVIGKLAPVAYQEEIDRRSAIVTAGEA